MNGEPGGLISVVTAVHPSGAAHLDQAHSSLLAQEMPVGWAWEWLLQEDGGGDTVARSLPSDPRMRFAANGRQLGTATTRNLAAARASGRLVKVLDADDVLTPGALAREITILSDHPAIGWTTAAVIDLNSSGATIGWHDDPPEGELGKGTVFDYWLQHEHRAQIHPATLCIRSEALWASGGWMALPFSEDTGLLMALSSLWAGYFIGTPGLLYRKWPSQTTASSSWEPVVGRQARHEAIVRRVRAIDGMLRRSTPER
ncbi:MAG: glycosyltransferase [Pseudonocardia sp.]|nr:glycosyltransferase [Pseudonocardia sp.]